MKIKFVLGPYGYEVVLGNISEQVYNKYSQDNDALRDAVTGFEEDPEIKEWSDMDDIAHNYGPVLEEEGTDQYLKIVNERNQVFTCGSGVTACILAMANKIINDKDPVIYDGSWSEYGLK